MTFIRRGARVVVTGATGFVGQTLVELLNASGYRVIGISDGAEPPDRIRDFLFSYHCADLTREWPDVGPFEGMVHLAGLAAVGPSFGNPQQYLNVNSSMVTNLFEFALRNAWKGRAIVVSSGAVYGQTTEGERFTEASAVAASSPYVVSKLLVENQTEYYRRLGIDAVITRPFNHIGPGQHSGFIVPDLAGKVQRWRIGEKMMVGNLNTSRDYTDVRDVANAYMLLLERTTIHHHIYNVCSGITVSGWEILEGICKELGCPTPTVELADSRAIDPLVISGDAKRLQSDTGWKPQISLSKSLADALHEIAGTR